MQLFNDSQDPKTEAWLFIQWTESMCNAQSYCAGIQLRNINHALRVTALFVTLIINGFQSRLPENEV